MSEWAHLLRLLVQGDKEFKVTAVRVFGNPTKFTSQLTSGHTRKFLGVYNNSDSASGEIVWGASDADINGMPIPQGALVNIPLSATPASVVDSSAMDLYFSNMISGENGGLRVLEIA